MRDLPLLHELLDGAGHVLDRHLRIDPVLVEEIDAVDAQALQRRLGHGLDVLGPAVEADPPRTAVGIELEAELRGDDDLAAKRLERFADQPLVGERAVDLGRVEERHAPLDGRAHEPIISPVSFADRS